MVEMLRAVPLARGCKIPPSAAEPGRRHQRGCLVAFGGAQGRALLQDVSLRRCEAGVLLVPAVATLLAPPLGAGLEGALDGGEVRPQSGRRCAHARPRQECRAPVRLDLCPRPRITSSGGDWLVRLLLLLMVVLLLVFQLILLVLMLLLVMLLPLLQLLVLMLIVILGVVMLELLLMQVLLLILLLLILLMRLLLLMLL